MKTLFWGNDSLTDLSRWKKPLLRTSQALHACPSYGSYYSVPWQLKYHFVPYIVNVSQVKNPADSSLFPPSCIASAGLASALLLEGCSYKQHLLWGKLRRNHLHHWVPLTEVTPGKAPGALRTACCEPRKSFRRTGHCPSAPPTEKWQRCLCLLCKWQRQCTILLWVFSGWMTWHMK